LLYFGIDNEYQISAEPTNVWNIHTLSARDSEAIFRFAFFTPFHHTEALCEKITKSYFSSSTSFHCQLIVC